MSHTFEPNIAIVDIDQVLAIAQVVYLSNEGDLKILTYHRCDQMHWL